MKTLRQSVKGHRPRLKGGRPTVKTLRQSLKMLRQVMKGHRPAVKMLRPRLKTLRRELKTYRQGRKRVRRTLKGLRTALKIGRQLGNTSFRGHLQETDQAAAPRSRRRDREWSAIPPYRQGMQLRHGDAQISPVRLVCQAKDSIHHLALAYCVLGGGCSGLPII